MNRQEPKKCRAQKRKWHKLFHRKPKKLRHRRENHKLQPNERQNEKVKKIECRSKGEAQKSRIQIHAGLENCNLHFFNLSETDAIEDMPTK